MSVKTGRRLIPTLAVALLVGGCALFHAPSAPGHQQTVRLHVDNQNFNDATLYVRYEGGAPIRLGQVTGKTQDVFSFRYHPGRVRIEIRLLAGGTHLTDPIAVDPGDDLDLIIPSNIDNAVIR
ncbi:MAG TPA: hypothetical protein VJ957_06215 [Longimicrobiales bacterium]|nr:hypothetical protein [Longimicrobiales bacterium]